MAVSQAPTGCVAGPRDLRCRAMSTETDPPAQSDPRRPALRPPRVTDVGWLTEMISDRGRVGPHNWGGPVDTEVVRARLTAQVEAGATPSVEWGRLIVALDDETPIGTVSWAGVRWGPSPESVCPSIGIALLPEFRRRGHGSVAQHLLARHLFGTLPIGRVQANTAVDNRAERKALERAGFTCEGLIRASEWRNGRFVDHLLYAVVRGEIPGT
jgi:RimJ/RimL family protein N-acetyltransferase